MDLKVRVEQVGHHDDVYLWRLIGHSSSMGHGKSLMKCEGWGSMGEGVVSGQRVKLREMIHIIIKAILHRLCTKLLLLDTSRLIEAERQ